MINSYSIRTSYPARAPGETKWKIFDAIANYCHDSLVHMDFPISSGGTVVKVKTNERIDTGRLAEKLDGEFGGWDGRRRVVLGISCEEIRERVPA